MKTREKLKFLDWCQNFELPENGKIYRRTAVRRGDKIGCFSDHEPICYIPGETYVIPLGNVLADAEKEATTG